MVELWAGPVVDQYWFDFDRVSVPAISTAGTTYQRLAWIGMPRLPREVIEATFYLYKSEEDARAGKAFGGSGFLVAIPAESGGRFFVYGVTNWHVAVQGGASVIRINKKGGGADIFAIDPAHWLFKPGWHDVAVVPIALDMDVHQAAILGIDLLATADDIKNLSIGPGEDVFMIGRFVDHDGGDTNVPAARFGNISVMPQPIPQPTGSKEPSYILDIHSRTGYSGSPVFVYRTLGGDLVQRALIVSSGVQILKLLGIHWGQFPEKWEIGRSQKKGDIVNLSDDAAYVTGMSGMTMAVPASAIRELLDLPELVKGRVEGNEQLRLELEKAAEPKAEITAESAVEQGPDNPSHKEDFMSLLSAAAQSNKPAS